VAAVAVLAQRFALELAPLEQQSQLEQAAVAVLAQRELAPLEKQSPLEQVVAVAVRLDLLEQVAAVPVRVAPLGDLLAATPEHELLTKGRQRAADTWPPACAHWILAPWQLLSVALRPGRLERLASRPGRLERLASALMACS
jgi:hypothetical protein